MMKLDLAAPDRYVFPIETQVLAANVGEYHMEQVGEHDERLDVTRRHHNLDGTCDIYALVETGGEYLVHTPEKIQQLRIREGGEVDSIHIKYRNHT
jgi:hypothetical protein